MAEFFTSVTFESSPDHFLFDKSTSFVFLLYSSVWRIKHKSERASLWQLWLLMRAERRCRMCASQMNSAYCTDKESGLPCASCETRWQIRNISAGHDKDRFQCENYQSSKWVKDYAWRIFANNLKSERAQWYHRASETCCVVSTQSRIGTGDLRHVSLRGFHFLKRNLFSKVWAVCAIYN